MVGVTFGVVVVLYKVVKARYAGRCLMLMLNTRADDQELPCRARSSVGGP